MHSSENKPPDATVPFWVGALADFLRLQHGVEAVRVSPSHREVSVATSAGHGPIDEALLQYQLHALLEAADAWHPSQASTKLPGRGGPVEIRQEAESLVIAKPSCLTAPKLWHWRKYDWPDAEGGGTGDEWKMLAVQAGVCGITLLLAWLWQKLGFQPPGVAYGLLLVSILAGGWDAAIDAWPELKRGRLDVHFLMLAVAAGACFIGAWTEGALLLFLFSASGAMEHYAEHRTHEEISALARLTPKTANVVLSDGNREARAVALLAQNDVVELKSDETFPADGIVLQGETTVDESTLTGESVPVTKSVGSEVYSGTLNQWGAVLVRLTKPAQQSTVQHILKLIHEARLQRSPSERFTERFGTSYTVGILVLSFVAFLFWWQVSGLPAFHNAGETRSAFYRAIALLVVASPCALVLSIPSAILASIARGARLGVLFRSGAAVEKLAEVDTVAMDKTGTLTTGEMRLQAVESFPPGPEQQARLLQLACSLERLSNHPIARAISAAGRAQGVELLEVSHFMSLTANGLRGSVAGEDVVLGRRELLTEHAGKAGAWLKELPPEPLAATEVWVVSPSILGRLVLVDQIREESGPVIAALKQDGIHTLMLTGDRRQTAAEVAQRLGVEDVRAGMTPESKLAALRELTAAGRKVAMVGDGVNDAPSLAAAHVAVTMGSRGSAAALQQADVALMNDRIDKFLTARRLSLAARSIIRQNLLLSLGTVAVMVAAALTTSIPLTLGVIAHEGSTVLVCLNSLRLLFWRDKLLP